MNRKSNTNTNAKTETTGTGTGNPHTGHRERVRAIFLERGFDGMPDHLVLEFLLFYAVPRADTNPIAHRLIQRFGNLQGVLDADVRELEEVKGVGRCAAAFLKVIPALCERYSKEKVRRHMNFSSLERAASFFIDYYLSKTEEEVTMLLLDNGNRLISFERVHVGSVNSSAVNPRKLVETAMKKNAVSLILAHNHPSGEAKPSKSDIDTTRHLMDAFLPIDLQLKAHFVVAGDRCTDILPMLYDRTRFQVRYIAVHSGDEEREEEDSSAYPNPSGFSLTQPILPEEK